MRMHQATLEFAVLTLKYRLDILNSNRRGPWTEYQLLYLPGHLVLCTLGQSRQVRIF